MRLVPTKQLEQREVGSLLTWDASFSTYIAVVAQALPERVADMLGYMRLILRKARKYGGNGWLTYDMVFRRNHEGTSEPWNYIDSSLHAAYIGGQGLHPLTPCRHCNEVDHSSADCAIAPTMAPVKTSSPHEHNRPVPPRIMTRRPPFAPSFPGSKRLCISWNRGRCLFPGACTYQHLCASCHANHPAKDCPHTPPNSGFKLPQRGGNN